MGEMESESILIYPLKYGRYNMSNLVSSENLQVSFAYYNAILNLEKAHANHEHVDILSKLQKLEQALDSIEDKETVISNLQTNIEALQASIVTLQTHIAELEAIPPPPPVVNPFVTPSVVGQTFGNNANATGVWVPITTYTKITAVARLNNGTTTPYIQWSTNGSTVLGTNENMPVMVNSLSQQTFPKRDGATHVRIYMANQGGNNNALGYGLVILT